MKNGVKWFICGLICGLMSFGICCLMDKITKPSLDPIYQEVESGTYHCMYYPETGEFTIYTQYKFISNNGDDLVVKGDFEDEMD